LVGSVILLLGNNFWFGSSLLGRLSPKRLTSLDDKSKVFIHRLFWNYINLLQDRRLLWKAGQEPFEISQITY
jgi:hypothetical protein